MPNYILKFGDSVVNNDFYSGETKPPTSGFFVQEGGLDLPPPAINAQFNQSNQADGAPMSRAVYGNRTITITFGIQGSSLADVKAKIRVLQESLNDAAYRYLLGAGSANYGNLYYLEHQWGTSAGQSTYFDIMRGDLILPSDWLNSTKLTTGYVLLGCKLVLTCLPFGRYTTQNISIATLQNGAGNLLIGDAYIASYYTPDTAQTVALTSLGTINSTTYRLAQTFTPGANYTCSGFCVFLTLTAGTVGNLYMELYATSAGLPTGAALATCNVVSTAIPTSGNTASNWVFGAFGTPYAVTSGTMYAIVIRCPNWVSGAINLWGSSGGNPYASGTQCYAANGSTWTSNATNDACFAVFYATTKNNYQEIATDASYGDVPAGTQLKISSSANYNLWVAKRSGNATLPGASVPRYQEPLSIQGGNYALFQTDSAGITNTGIIPVLNGTTLTSQLADGASAYIQTNVTLYNIGHYSYALTGISQGTFRVLCRCRVTDITKQSFSMGWGSTTASASGSTCSSGTDTITGSPISLVLGLNSIPAASASGTCNVSLTTGVGGYVISGTTAVTGSPVTLNPAANTTLNLTGAGYFVIVLLPSPYYLPTALNAVIPSTNQTWQVLDMGQLLIPSLASPGPDGISRMPQYLNIFMNLLGNANTHSLYYDIDWIFLMPVDEGYANVKTLSGYTLIDTISKTTGVYDTNSSYNTVSNYWPSVGPLPQVGRENTRFYVIVDYFATATPQITTSYQPRFITI